MCATQTTWCGGAPGPLARYHGQSQTRRASAIVENHLLRAEQFRVFTEGASRVRVSIEPRKVAAGHLQSYAMSGQNRLLVAPKSMVSSTGCLGVSSAGRRSVAAVAGAQDTVGQRSRCAIWKHVHELAGEVRVPGRGRDPQRERDRTGHLEIGRQRRRSSRPRRHASARLSADRMAFAK